MLRRVVQRIKYCLYYGRNRQVDFNRDIIGREHVRALNLDMLSRFRLIFGKNGKSLFTILFVILILEKKHCFCSDRTYALIEQSHKQGLCYAWGFV